MNASNSDAAGAHVIAALYRMPGSASPVAIVGPAPTAPSASEQGGAAAPLVVVVPALGPLRVLPVDPPKREDLKTGLKLGRITL